MTTTTTNSVLRFELKGQAYESTMTEGEVAQQLQLGIESGVLRGDFPADLLGTYRRRRNGWSPKQKLWAYKLVIDAVGRVEAEAAEREAEQSTVGPYKAFYDYVAGCRERRENGGKGLKFPKIALKRDGHDLAIKLTGAGSRRPNHVSLAESHTFGAGKFYGYVTPEGHLKARGDLPEAIVSLLADLNTDANQTIADNGRELGCCCFCNAALSKVQSKIAGCGSTCAHNWGVPYPTAAEARAAIAERPELLTGSTDAERWA